MPQRIASKVLRLLLVTALALLRPGAARAQSATATLAGVIRAQTGTPVVGASVSFTGVGSAAATDPGGHFRLSIPAEAPGVLTVRAVGFASITQQVAAVPAGGVRQVAMTLAPLYVLDALTVVARRDRPLLNTEDAATGGALERSEIAALPTDAREPLALALTIPGVAQATGFFGDAPILSINGANSLYTQYNVDGLDNNEGFLGGPRVEFPLAAVSRLGVLANTYSPEWGRSSNGVVNLETRSGGSKSFGEAFVFYRPGGPFDARPPFLAPDLDPKGFRRLQIGAGIGGPIRHDRTFGFATIEYGNEVEDRNPSTAQASFVGQEKREKWKVFSRLDHGWSSTQTTTFRLALSDVRRAGTGGGVVVPEAEITTRRVGSLASLTHRSGFRRGGASNILSAQLGTFHWYFPPTRSDFATPQVTIIGTDQSGRPDPGAVQAVVGSSNFVFDEREFQIQLRDVFETRLGNHALRIGADLVTSSFELAGSSTNPAGAYVVVNEGNIRPAGGPLSIRDVPASVRVYSYTIDARRQQVDLSQTQIGAFIEDRWRVSTSLLLSGGLRWDYDDITSRGASRPDLDNFQPRLSFNWLANTRSVVRGGFGLYTGKFPYAVYSDAVQFGPDGNAVVTFQEGTGFPAPAFGQGPSQGQLQNQINSLPPREIRRLFALGLKQPFSYQGSIGYQRQFGGDWAVSIDGVWVETRNLPRSRDLNAITRPLTPADSLNRSTDFGDQFRPVAPVAGSFRRLTTTESAGRSRYWGLYTTVRHRFSDGVSADANWVWSRARNDTEDINFTAAQGNDFAAEYADAVNDRRHKVTLRALYAIHPRLRLTTIADFQTGTPINRVAFFRDLDGSGDNFGVGFVGNHDRLPGVPRNGERLPSNLTFSFGVTYRVPVGAGDFEIRAEGFNLLNAIVESGFANGIPGGGPRTQVGRPGDPIVYTQAGPPRQLQFSVTFVF